MRPRFQVAPVEQRTMDGIVFASKREMKRYAELKLLERAGDIHRLDLQPEYEVFIDGRHFCTYTADFRYITTDLEIVVEDVKSTGTAKDAAYRLRKKAAELYYGMKVTEFNPDKKLTKRKKSVRIKK